MIKPFNQLSPKAQQACTEAQRALFMHNLNPTLATNLIDHCRMNYSTAASDSSRSTNKSEFVIPVLSLNTFKSVYTNSSNVHNSSLSKSGLYYSTKLPEIAIDVLWNLRYYLCDYPEALVALALGCLVHWPSEFNLSLTGIKFKCPWKELLNELYRYFYYYN